MPRKSKKALLYEKAAENLSAHKQKLKRRRLAEEGREEGRKEPCEDHKARLRLVYHMKKKLKRSQGEIICKGEVKQVLRLYLHLVLRQKMGHDSALHYVSEALGVSKSIVKDARDEFVQYHTIRARNGAKRGGRHGAKAPPGTIPRLRERIELMNHEGRQVTAVALQKWLSSEPEEDEAPGRIPIQVSHKTVCNWVHDLGFRREKGKPGYTLSAEETVTVEAPPVPPVPSEEKASLETGLQALEMCDEADLLDFSSVEKEEGKGEQVVPPSENLPPEPGSGAPEMYDGVQSGLEAPEAGDGVQAGQEVPETFNGVQSEQGVLETSYGMQSGQGFLETGDGVQSGQDYPEASDGVQSGQEYLEARDGVQPREVGVISSGTNNVPEEAA